MANTNPARGMRDFLPADVRKRDYVIGIIKEVYESYGFEPLETPAVENIETLTGKYGEEGNQLIFKILKRGEKLRESQESLALDSRLSTLDSLADLALRYDLTVPLARVVANNRNELPKFFKRYQIQPVWRADRPARGRFREFWQCDVDVIGSESMVVEAEICAATSEVLLRLGFRDFKIKVNHRKLLEGVLKAAGIEEENHDKAMVILDKIDKIGFDGAEKEFDENGLSGFGRISQLYQRLFLRQTVGDMLGAIDEFIGIGGESYDQPAFDINNFFSYFDCLDFSTRYGVSAEDLLFYDVTLARGLSYYTGAILEIVLTNGDFRGSIAGGGRYDGLIGMFGKEQIPACGFSLGLERILVVMDERNMFPPEIAASNSADVMVTIWNEDSIGESLKLANELRQQGLRVIVYPEADKLGKQFKYAAQINVQYVCVLGESELAENKVTLKNMETGEQTILEREDIVSRIKS